MNKNKKGELKKEIRNQKSTTHERHERVFDNLDNVKKETIILI